MKNVIWFQYINSIGGVESVIWNVVRKYKSYDITVWYNTADKVQLYRLSKFVKLLKFQPGQHIECDNLIVNYGYNMIEGHYTAKRIVYMVHANYKYLKDKGMGTACTDPRFEYYAVSQWAADNYYAVSGIQPKVCYNPILIDDNREALIIVSATRITRDKGDMVKRMETLANHLEQRNIPFLWLVFTNSTERINNRNVINVPQRLDILPFLKKADFVAQLSDSEAFCMTALETATLGTPLLLTRIPSFTEMDLKEDENAIYFDFDMSNVDEAIDKMVSKKYKFTYTPKEDIWNTLLAPTKGYEVEEKIKVQAIREYYDVLLAVTVNKFEEYYVSKERAIDLENKKVAQIIKEKGGK